MTAWACMPLLPDCPATTGSRTASAVYFAMVPIVLKAVGQDPATSSSIVLTTFTDCGGFLSFLGLATLLSSLLPPG